VDNVCGQQTVLALCKNTEYHDRLWKDFERHGWTGLVTASACAGKTFLDILPKEAPAPLIFIVADSDADLDHFSILLQQVIRPRKLVPVVLKTTEIGKKSK
jgi:hypothetical protein